MRKASDSEESQREEEPKRQSYFALKSRATGSKGDCTKDFFMCDFEQLTTAERYEFKVRSSKVPQIEPEKNKELMDLLQTNNNILFFGQGSKFKLLERLAEHFHKYGLNVLVIRGYMASVNERTILSELKDFLEDLVGIRGDKLKGTDEHIKYFHQLFETRNFPRLLLVIHSIDGPHLLSAEGQEFLGKICGLPRVQVIGSFDNIGTPYRWSHPLLSVCRWVFFHVATYENYEKQLRNKLPRDSKRERVQDSLKYIWKSLTANQKDILKLLAQHELLILERKEQRRLNLHELLERCRDNMVLSNEVQLRDNLLQIIDHRVVTEVSGKTEGNRLRKQYQMTYDRKVLQSIVDGLYEKES